MAVTASAEPTAVGDVDLSVEIGVNAKLPLHLRNPGEFLRPAVVASGKEKLS